MTSTKSWYCLDEQPNTGVWANKCLAHVLPYAIGRCDVEVDCWRLHLLQGIRLLHAHACACVHSKVQAHPHTYTGTDTHADVHVCVQAQMHMCAHTRARVWFQCQACRAELAGAMRSTVQFGRVGATFAWWVRKLLLLILHLSVCSRNKYISVLNDTYNKLSI